LALMLEIFFVMVTSVGAPRRSLRRRMANATAVPPKAARCSDAFGDHQPTPITQKSSGARRAVSTVAHVE